MLTNLKKKKKGKEIYATNKLLLLSCVNKNTVLC